MLLENNISVWEGVLDLKYHYKDNKTQVKSVFCRSPFKMQQSFYPENNDVCHSTILHTAGGIVGGDILNQNIHLTDNCHSFITTPSAGKIYKTNGQIAQQIIKITIDNNSYLEFFPQENIIFNGANYQQQYQIELAENSQFCMWEIDRFGRTAMGENFIMGDWKSSCEIKQNGKLIWVDRQFLQGNKDIYKSINGLNNYAISASFYWMGKEISKELITQFRQLAKLYIHQGESGVTQGINGLICRYRGNSISEVKNWFLEIWGILRQEKIQKNKFISRIWQL